MIAAASLRQARRFERTGAAAFFVAGQRRPPGRDEGVQIGTGRARGIPQGRIEGHGQTSPRAAVEDRPGLDAPRQHFFQTKRLRAKLYLVAGVGFGLAELVFHGKNDFPFPSLVEFHHVGHAGKAKFHGATAGPWRAASQGPDRTADVSRAPEGRAGPLRASCMRDGPVVPILREAPRLPAVAHPATSPTVCRETGPSCALAG